MATKNGRARNARLNQARRHLETLANELNKLYALSPDRKDHQVDAWQNGRNALEQLTQCFHEASAYNNTVE